MYKTESCDILQAFVFLGFFPSGNLTSSGCCFPSQNSKKFCHSLRVRTLNGKHDRTEYFLSVTDHQKPQILQDRVVVLIHIRAHHPELLLLKVNQGVCNVSIYACSLLGWTRDACREADQDEPVHQPHDLLIAWSPIVNNLHNDLIAAQKKSWQPVTATDIGGEISRKMRFFSPCPLRGHWWVHQQPLV